MNLDLSPHGFISKGESWWINTGGNHVAVIAIGGKYSRPNTLCRTVCIRNQDMRTQDEIVPTGMIQDPFDYPVKLTPEEAATFIGDKWKYEPQLLNYPLGYLESQEQCDHLVRAVIENILPWAERLTDEVWLSQLIKHGQDGWIERLWIEDLAR